MRRHVVSRPRVTEVAANIRRLSRGEEIDFFLTVGSAIGWATIHKELGNGRGIKIKVPSDRAKQIQDTLLKWKMRHLHDYEPLVRLSIHTVPIEGEEMTDIYCVFRRFA